MFEAIVTVFGICELGERVSMAFDEISLALDQLKWYLLPREAWKSLPIILVVAQESVGLTIFGSISCNRIVFKEVSSDILMLDAIDNRRLIFECALGVQ